jgi:multiple sugar transport system permease protein
MSDTARPFGAASPSATAPDLAQRVGVDPLPYLLIAPILLLMFAITVYPLTEAVRLAFSDASLLRLHRASFTGLQNLYRLLGDTVFWESLWRTARWVLAVVLLELALALPIALFLNRTFRGRGFVRAAVMIPYITPPAVVGFLFVYMFDGSFGVVNDILYRLGVIESYRAWLSEPLASFWITVSAMVWYGSPLFTLIILAALQTIPAELYEAAEVDGAGRFAQFRSITLPHILPSIMFLTLLRTIWMANHVDMIFVVTGGGPGFSNYTAAIYSFQLTTQYEIGYASATAVALALILFAGAAFYVRHLARTVLSETAR